MSKSYVLYVDHQGHPAPLTECFHATASRRLSSTVEDRFPPSTVTEVDSAYCPQCLSFHDAASAARLGFCPKATCQRCPICVSAVATITAADNLCFYQCGQCEWTSRGCSLTVPLEGEGISKLELARAAEDLGNELCRRRQQEPDRMLSNYFSTVASAWENENAISSNSSSRNYQKPLLRLSSSQNPDNDAWSLEALEASLESKRKQHYEIITSTVGQTQEAEAAANGRLVVQRTSLDKTTKSSATDPSLLEMTLHAFQMQALGSPDVIPKHRADCLPLPMPLRVRRSRRCRAELAEGRPGILVKPKLNPLEGDSSLRTGHGQWWKKDSSAIHVIPRVVVLRHNNVSEESSQQPQHRIFLLKVSNPTLGVVRLRFTASSYRGEPVWEDALERTTTLPNLLVDTLMQTRLDIELDTTALRDLPATETVELLSAEDSIMELGGKAREIPEQVVAWDASKTAAAAGKEAFMKLVAQSTSDAWFELAVPASKLSTTAKRALPIQLQVELGKGSWESSLIKPKDVDGKELDWVHFDLVITWEV